MEDAHFCMLHICSLFCFETKTCFLALLASPYLDTAFYCPPVIFLSFTDDIYPWLTGFHLHSQLRPSACGTWRSTWTTTPKLCLWITDSLIAKGLPSHTTPPISSHYLILDPIIFAETVLITMPLVLAVCYTATTSYSSIVLIEWLPLYLSFNTTGTSLEQLFWPFFLLIYQLL